MMFLFRVCTPSHVTCGLVFVGWSNRDMETSDSFRDTEIVKMVSGKCVCAASGNGKQSLQNRDFLERLAHVSKRVEENTISSIIWKATNMSYS